MCRRRSIKVKVPPKPRTVSRKHWESVSPHKIRSVNLENEGVESSNVVHDVTGQSEHVHDESGPSEHVHDDTGPSEDVHDDLPRKFVDKGKGVMTDNDTRVHARKPKVRNKGIVIEENVNPSGMTDSSSESEAEIPDYSMLYDDSESEMSDRSIDYLSEGEDELIELRRRNFEAKRAPKVKKQGKEPQAAEGSSRQKKWDGIGENDIVLEHEEFLDDLMRKLKGCDDGVNLKDPFQMVETNVERYPVYDADTHWKILETEGNNSKHTTYISFYKGYS